MGIFTPYPNRKFLFLLFPENPKICVVCSLSAYVKRTKGLRKPIQLFVSFMSSYKAILSQAVSRCLTRALRMAGIEFCEHSTRGASVSAGLSSALILEVVDWAFVQTFKRFYHRESSAGVFATLCLSVRLISIFTLRNTS